MARPKKIGLEYFPLDCQMDDKVEMLEAEHGLVGFAVYLKLLQHIYQTENAELDMSIVFRWKTLGKQLDMPVETLQLHVETMFAVGLFDRQAFTERQVLTSNGIQKRRVKVAGLREKDRSRKTEGDSADSPEFSAGKPSENGGKGKGKTTNVVQKEKETPPAPGEGDSQKKIGAENFAVDAQAPAPTSPPVAAPPHSFPTWPPADPAQPFPGVVLPFASPEFAALWGRWRLVAIERGVGYRGANSEQEHLLHLTRFSGTDNEALAIDIIEQTLASPTWKNFYELKSAPAPSAGGGRGAAASQVNTRRNAIEEASALRRNRQNQQSA